jgi:polysaccharide biosynthesis transport protein
MATASGNGFSIFSLLDALRRRKFVVIIPAILLTLGFSVFAHYQPDKYKATAVLAAQQMTPPEYLKHVAPPPLHIEDHLWVVREILFSPPVLEGAAREMKQFRNTKDPIPPQVVEQMKGKVVIKVDGEHSFTVSYDASDPYDAMNVTNKLSQLFVERSSAQGEKKIQDAQGAINDQLEALKKRLTEQSKNLHDYKQQAVHALPDHIDDNFRQVESLQTEYKSLESKIADEDARRNAIRKQLEELQSNGVLDQPVVQEKSTDELKLEELRFKEKDLETRYTARHPELVQIRRQISDLEKLIATQPKKHSEPSAAYLRYVDLKAELDAINQRIDSYKREQPGLLAQISSYSRRIEATPQNERVIEDMKREYDVGESQFHALLDKQLDSKLATELAQSDTGIAFGVVEPASLPAAPYSPQRERLVLMGLAAGLGLGLVMAFLLEQNDTTFANVDDFQAFTTLPVIGVVPNISTKRGKLSPDNGALISITDPDSVAAEQYRILAMKVQQQCAASKSQIIMMTSAAGGEGKSLTAINLALALNGISEGKVLLIDADMRKPRTGEYLGITAPAGRGFDSLLVRPDDDPSKYIIQVKNLSVIPGAPCSGNPVAALSSPKARALFDKLKSEFAFIVVDAPPTLPIADSHILSGLSDKVLFIVRARATPRELFQHAVEGFDAANLLGAVLNDVNYERSRYAYAYQYYKKAA